MKRWALLFTVGLFALPLFAVAQSAQFLTISSPSQPQSGTALPSATVSGVAIVLTAGNGPVSVTGLTVAKVGSAGDGAIVTLDVRDSATNVLTSVSASFDSSHAITIPLSVSLAASQSKTLLVSATTAGNLTPYIGQFFELNITGVSTGAVVSGNLPVFGAQYTLSSGVNKPTCTITPSSSSFTVGQTVNLTWTSTNATEGSITGLGSVATHGTQGILPTGATATYTGTFSGAGGTGTCSVTLTRVNPNGTGGGVSTPGSVDSPGSVSGPGGVNGGGTVSGPGTVGAPGSVSAPGTVPAPAGTGSSVSTPTGPQPITPDPRTAPGTGGTSGIGDVCRGINCTLCNLADLAQKIINFFLGLSIPLAAALFAYAGILYFSSAASPTNIERARHVFVVVGLGVVVVLSAWLVAQLVLYTLLTPDQYRSWNTLQCIPASSRPTREDASSLFSALRTVFSSGTNSLSTSGSTGGSVGSESLPAGSPNGTYTDEQARVYLAGNNVTVNKDCGEGGTGTCLTGVLKDTLTGVTDIASGCQLVNGGGSCNLIVTGGTETAGGHACSGTDTASHCNGSKIDFGLSQPLTTYITAKGTYLSSTSLGPKYQLGSTVCVKETNHWDCTF